jgi:4-oxalocrotonate tautomerase
MSNIGNDTKQAVMTRAHCTEQSVSVVIEDVEPAEWTEKVYNTNSR